jgi:methylglutaconyl-CoA hydratase
MIVGAGHRVEIDPRGVARITLTRPETHNAFDVTLIAGLTDSLAKLGADAAVRAVILAGEGSSFSAGADLNWMLEQAEQDDARNLDDARKLAALMRTLDRLSKPTIARVHGPAHGGGVGLVACCDIAVATHEANFSFAEVKLGLIPAVISPYVIAAVGPRWARRLFQTGERFDAQQAAWAGLVHEIVKPAELDARIANIVSVLLSNAPEAMAEAKDLIFAVAGRPLDETLLEDTARRIAGRRASAEGREGVAAFLAKRKPSWQKPGG